MSKAESSGRTLLNDAEQAISAGDLTVAENTIQAALDQGYPEREALPLLHAVLLKQGRLPDAYDAIKRAISFAPDHPTLLLHYAQTSSAYGHHIEGLNAIDRSLMAQPDWAPALAVKASILQQTGRSESAVNLLRALDKKDPDDGVIQPKLMLALHGDPTADLSEIATLAKRAWRNAPSTQPLARACDSDPGKQLKIAFVSGDFREHPVAYFLQGFLKHYDRERFAVHLVSTTALADDLTTHVQALSDGWHTIAALSDEDATSALRDHGFDIAIDLSGWTLGHRLGLFRNRIAPVQATWIGYSGTTGLEQMDYIICDHTVLPVSHEPFYTETPLRLPQHYLSLEPPTGIIQNLPPRTAPRSERIVFGSFNSLTKITEEVISTWAHILNRVEGSLLYLRVRQLVDDGVKADIAMHFKANGVDVQRLVLLGNTTRKELLQAYRKMDITLDTFPYGGTTTTFEALCMGVPVVTLACDRWVGRVGASALRMLGHTELIAEDPESYVDIAVSLAKDPSRLTRLRETLSADVLKSPLCDTAQHTSDVESALRLAWHDYCQLDT